MTTICALRAGIPTLMDFRTNGQVASVYGCPCASSSVFSGDAMCAPVRRYLGNLCDAPDAADSMAFEFFSASRLWMSGPRVTTGTAASFIAISTVRDAEAESGLCYRDFHFIASISS